MKHISVPSRRWYENTERVLSFPDRWKVDNLTSPGLDKPNLTNEQIKTKINEPIAGKSLAEIAKDRKEAVIVFDDMTRPTPIEEVATHILDILHESGMTKEQIRFIWALGSHGTYDMINARKKLGDYIVENYAIYNHDAFQNLIHAGKTPQGLSLWFNREFMECDLKIAIGCVTPHVQAGFGGGAKIILPGVAGIETIKEYHNRLLINPASGGLGNYEGNVLKTEIDCAGDIVGLDFKVDCLINRRGEIAELFAGDFRATHNAAAEAGKDHYGIELSANYDIVISNAYAKVSEAAISGLLALMAIKPGGAGIAVIIMDCPEGQVPHYVFRSWGKKYGGDQWTYNPPGTRFVPHVFKQIILLNPTPDRTCMDLVSHNDDITFVKTWEEVLTLLETEFPGDAEVGVIQDGTMQYIKAPEQ